MRCLDYSFSFDYDFEFIPEDLGFFQRRSFIREKIQEKPENSLVFIQKDKFLSVVVDSSCNCWLPYEKAVLFYSFFKLSEKYVLISENDDFFYGYIDGFPCVFKNSYEEAFSFLNEYSDGDPIFCYGIGKVTGDFVATKSLLEVYSILELPKNVESSVVMEDSEPYGLSYDELPFSKAYFDWQKQQSIRSEEQKVRGYRYIIFGCVFLFFGFVCNYFF